MGSVLNHDRNDSLFIIERHNVFPFNIFDSALMLYCLRGQDSAFSLFSSYWPMLDIPKLIVQFFRRRDPNVPWGHGIELGSSGPLHTSPPQVGQSYSSVSQGRGIFQR